MARHIAADNQEMYRAVVTTTVDRDHTEPYAYTKTMGPYTTVGQAKAIVTRLKNEASRRISRQRGWSAPQTYTVEGYVELAEVVWRRVS